MSASDDNIKTAENNEDESISPAYAVALGYAPGRNNAPQVLAKGQGQIAEKIIQIALDEGKEIHRDADLIQILKELSIDNEIPLEAFAAVAEIISYIYQANNKTLPET